jgi:predicted chitinase
MESLLNSIVKSQAVTNKELSEQTSVLNDILDVQVAIDKEASKRSRRESQAAKRKEKEVKNPLQQVLGKESKKKGKGILGTIGDTIGMLFKGLGAVGLLKALGLTAIGTFVGAYFKSPEFRETINKAFGGIKDAMGDFLFGNDGVFNKKKRAEFGKAIGDFFTKDAQWKKDARAGIKSFFVDDAPWKKNIRDGFMDLVDMITKPVREAFAKFDQGVKDFGSQMRNGLNKFFTGREVSADTSRTRQRLDAAKGKQLDAKIRGKSDPEADAAVLAETKLLRLQNERDNMQRQRENIEKRIKTERRASNKVKLEKQLEDLNTNLQIKQKQLQGFQSGGFVGIVPNQGGNGDRFNTMVAPGSVVLNQTAAGHFQNGGQVPVKLEQGEKVFGPRDPNAGAALMMNSMIGRFQNGGLVQASHSQTGTGFQPKGMNDANGRPLVLSEGGAEAFLKMAQQSGGKVKSSDVNSAKRSKSKNSAEGGATNSNHLYGNGLDVQSGSSSWNWMKSNASSHGWHWNDYLGPQGWHWDYTGAKSKGTNPDEGNEDGIAKEQTSTKKGIMDIFSSFGSGVGGEAFNELLPGFVDGLGAIGSTIMSALGPIGDMLMGSLGGLMGVSGANDSKDMGIGPPSTPGGDFGEKSLIAAMNKAGMNNKRERAQFLAQMSHESGNFNYDEEIHDGSNYEGRSDLGNTQAGDGKRYKGRGYIQLTGRANYKRYGDMVGQDLVNNPDLAKDPNIASDIALAYWKDRGISGPAKAGDTKGVTKIINGGYNGLSDREQKYDQYMKKGYQTGGVANMSGTSSYSSSMVKKSQEQFASKIAESMSPTIIPVPMGGGSGGGQVIPQPATDTQFPNLPSEDSSVVSMEYKYRITMGASV